MAANAENISAGITATISIAVVGSGGAGAITVGNMILESSASLGLYGMLTRSVGPQIRGGEAAALVQLGRHPVNCPNDTFDILLAMDWNNANRFAAEIPLGPDSTIISDPEQGEIPKFIADSGAKVYELPLSALARKIKKGRVNMIALGVIAEITGLAEKSVEMVLAKKLGDKGESAVHSSLEAVNSGREAGSALGLSYAIHSDDDYKNRWIINGNQATGYGALIGGIRFVAAYPITPATEVLEWLASAFQQTGGTLVQAEDELASINMIIGASYGGVPSLTATSGPGLSLMMEGIGLAVSAEVPVVIVDVMRVGPSTGIATKAEQGDLNIAIYGLHGDAPHLVLAPVSVVDCLYTAQWAVFLAESMQVPAIVLSDQYLGQAMTIIDEPDTNEFHPGRIIAPRANKDYRRYELTENGISPMAIPGTPGGQYTADGLEHSTTGSPSTSAGDHSAQMDKRMRKVMRFDYGRHWADVEGSGDLAVITWGSTTGTIREALTWLRQEGIENIRLVAIRLLAPVQPEKFAHAMEGVDRVLVIELNHSAQFYHYLRANYRLPDNSEAYHRPGPLLFRPEEIYQKIKKWSQL